VYNSASVPPASDTTPSEPDVTTLLEDWSRHGRRETLDRLVSVVYGDLHRAAEAQMARERTDHTLDVTALINEAFIRLVDQRRVQWLNRSHFVGVAAQCMRRVLVDHARRRHAEKRPQGLVPLDDIFSDGFARIDDVLPVHEALDRLARLDSKQASMVELRVFTGMSLEEVAEASGVSLATVKRELRTARAFLRAQLQSIDP
jgi:RNA polymerase sigma-70 factor, ECF subfamily